MAFASDAFSNFYGLIEALVTPCMPKQPQNAYDLVCPLYIPTPVPVLETRRQELGLALMGQLTVVFLRLASGHAMGAAMGFIIFIAGNQARCCLQPANLTGYVGLSFGFGALDSWELLANLLFLGGGFFQLPFEEHALADLWAMSLALAPVVELLGARLAWNSYLRPELLLNQAQQQQQQIAMLQMQQMHMPQHPPWLQYVPGLQAPPITLGPGQVTLQPDAMAPPAQAPGWSGAWSSWHYCQAAPSYDAASPAREQWWSKQSWSAASAPPRQPRQRTIGTTVQARKKKVPEQFALDKEDANDPPEQEPEAEDVAFAKGWPQSPPGSPRKVGASADRSGRPSDQSHQSWTQWAADGACELFSPTRRTCAGCGQQARGREEDLHGAGEFAGQVYCEACWASWSRRS